ncbi:uncharacterized protein IWZ02DRAFT_517931 [Phyllosticta citriasiana]|uniref:uncharacterized protein n=1 Tax=Phyllosticta citriasiana TaxID=595635 RepID=UPI0030FD5851
MRGRAVFCRDGEVLKGRVFGFCSCHGWFWSWFFFFLFFSFFFFKKKEHLRGWGWAWHGMAWHGICLQRLPDLMTAARSNEKWTDGRDGRTASHGMMAQHDVVRQTVRQHLRPRNDKHKHTHTHTHTPRNCSDSYLASNVKRNDNHEFRHQGAAHHAVERNEMSWCCRCVMGIFTVWLQARGWENSSANTCMVAPTYMGSSR